VLVLPVVAIERNIPVLYGTGGVLNDTRTMSNRTCDFVVDPPADNNSTMTVARGMLAGSHSYGTVLIILIGDLITCNHVVGARRNIQDRNMEDGEIIRGGYSVVIGDKFQ
jgi:hypothetical protein